MRVGTEVDSSSMGLPADCLHRHRLWPRRVFAHTVLLPRTLSFPSPLGYRCSPYPSAALSLRSESPLPLAVWLCLLSFYFHKHVTPPSKYFPHFQLYGFFLWQFGIYPTRLKAETACVFPIVACGRLAERPALSYHSIKSIGRMNEFIYCWLVGCSMSLSSWRGEE